MKDAIEPTLMQTLEETPVFVHAGAVVRCVDIQHSRMLPGTTLCYGTNRS